MRNVGEIINIALEKIEDANKSKLKAFFAYVSTEKARWPKPRSQPPLEKFTGDFASPRLNLRPSAVGNRTVIGMFMKSDRSVRGGCRKESREFYTPPKYPFAG
jgi:type I restriction enzyme M protein